MHETPPYKVHDGNFDANSYTNPRLQPPSTPTILVHGEVPLPSKSHPVGSMDQRGWRNHLAEGFKLGARLEPKKATRKARAKDPPSASAVSAFKELKQRSARLSSALPWNPRSLLKEHSLPGTAVSEWQSKFKLMTILQFFLAWFQGTPFQISKQKQPVTAHILRRVPEKKMKKRTNGIPRKIRTTCP